PTGVSLAFGEVTLTQDVLDTIAQHPKPNNVIVGIRPEHLADAALIDVYQRIRALTFQVKAEIVESLGSEKLVYFSAPGAGAKSVQLAELAAESEIGENEFVARLSAESKAKPGEQIELAFDTSKILVFDAESGANLTIPPPAE
ncbi:MAG TPA: ABC transporter ATP-binding protein, partial [Mycobacterium sp.]|nr:ABC transporter ATP-binding protein [Mycobacterium sp.]